MNDAFDYDLAFSRNIGWVTEEEQHTLRRKRVAIAGMGGVGGSHLLTLTRLGIGKFNIADMDVFGVENFNRQAGASMETINLPKLDVMAGMAHSINPTLEIKKFDNGLQRDNQDSFLENVDLYVDSLDFFAVKARLSVFAACYKKNIPAITAAPLGMGVAFLAFMPGKMSFEDYFQMEGRPENEQLLRFFYGLAPAGLQMKYLAENRFDLEGHKGPSTPMACELCAGVAGANALKILLNRGKVYAAPRGLHYDAYLNKLKKTWRPGGNKHPLQKLGLSVVRRKLNM